MDPLQFFTHEIGRFVTGDMAELRSKDQDNRPIAPDDQRFEFGVAYEKTAIWPLLAGPSQPGQESFHEYLSKALANDANAIQRMNNWFQAPGGKGMFSMKIADGDLPNARGQVNEHTKGKFVFYFSSLGFKTVNGQNQEIDVRDIKRGYFVQIAGNIKSNGQPGDRAGIYLNCSVVRLCFEGDVIVGGVDAETAFGGTTAPMQMPAGARPLGSTAGVAQAAPVTPDAVPNAAPVAAPVPTAPAAPATPVGVAGAAPSTVSPTNQMPAPHPQVLTPPPLPGT